MKIIQDNTIATVVFDGEPQKLKDRIDEYLYDELSEDIPGAQFSPSVRSGRWDGKSHFYDKKSHSFASGLINRATLVLDKVRFLWEFAYQVVDNRPDSFANEENIRNAYTLEKGKFKLREYQENAVNKIFSSGHGGIVNYGTGTGKTGVGAAAIKALLPSLKSDERIAMFTNNKEIFRQNKENLEKLLGMKVGYLGGGKKKIAKVMVCMIPTVDSYLKIEPTKGLSYSPKERQIQKMAIDYREKFIHTVNPYAELKSFVRLFRPIKKVDYKTKETLEDILYSCGSNEDVVRAFNQKLDEYNKIVYKKAKEKVDKKKFIEDLLDSFVMFIADECLVPNTLIATKTGNKRASSIRVGDNLEQGGKVLSVKKTDSSVVKIRHRFGSITGSLTHPLLIKNENGYCYKPMMMINKNDNLIVPLTKNIFECKKEYFNDEMGKIAYLVGMLYADGTFLSTRGNRSNTVRVNIANKSQFAWYRKVFHEGMAAISDVYLNGKHLNIADKLDIRGNLLLRITDKDVADILDDVYKLPFGKKSGKISVPEIILSNYRLQVPFYSGIVSCEGTISKEHSPRMIIDMCSERLVKDMILFFNNIGILATFNVVKRSNGHHSLFRASVGVDFFNVLSSLIPEGAPKHVEGKDHKLPARISKNEDGFIESPVKEISYLNGAKSLYDFETENHVFVADGVMSHNCHHSRADTWYNVLLSCRNAVYKVGLSGSIDQDDKLTWARLQGVFGGIIAKLKAKKLIDEGLLAKPTIIMANVESPGDIVGLKKWQDIYKAGIVENEYRNSLIAGLAKQSYDSGKTTLIIVSQIAHSDNISNNLQDLGVPYEVINGTQEDEDRKSELNRVKTGHTRVLIATSVLDEGVDISNIDVLIMAAGGKSMRQAIQRVGRVLRKKKNKENKATIFDFYDDTNRILRNHSQERLDIYEEQEFEIKRVGE